MKTFEFIFCAQCCRNSHSKDLEGLYKDICIASITNNEWVKFKGFNFEDFDPLKELEKGKFIVSIDHEACVFVKPNGIIELSEESYLICLKRKNHYGKMLSNLGIQ